MHHVLVLFTAKQWGVDNALLTNKVRKRICITACRLISYDYGFKKPFALTQIPRWEKYLTDSIEHGPSSSSSSSSLPTVTPLATKHHGTESYATKLDSQYPGYIRRLFRYAQKVKGALATFAELAQTSNEKSATIANHPITTLSRKQLNHWFTASKFKKLSM